MNVAYVDVQLLPDNEMGRRLAQVDAKDDEQEEEEAQTNDSIGTFLSAAVGKPEKDVRADLDDRNSVATGEFMNNEDAVLTDIKEHIGTEKVTRKRLGGVQARIVRGPFYVSMRKTEKRRTQRCPRDRSRKEIK